MDTTTASSALRLNVASGHPPFTVNSATRVPSLNADLLDGRDSTYFLPKTGKAANADKLDGIDAMGFVQGRGTALANRIVFVPTASKTLLTIPVSDTEERDA